ncbi:hypothetical protein AVEN_212718-1 [Araneus ventricosus]|uniref:MYND-type domain-containing protein n=1 Tax=Araneus ventricosus TaxID=182803 RepID=A0A4Y2JJV5_ARAVE|nr:hypothetical protein AVEN_212718-1 [Araneus ventricosus]
MNEPIYKRVASSALSQHVGKPVTLLGEFDQLEPNGRMFTLKTSLNSTVTVQLQDPMRALKLHPDDCELFNHNLDGEKHAFFRNHLPAFKRMWNEEGRVYWLRFLITFKMHFESNLYHRTGGDRLMNFIFIYIHKQFVEGSYSTAKTFIENIFIAAKHFHNLPEQSFTKNPFYTKESREAFRALLGKPDLDDEIPVPVMGFVCSVYFEFTSAVCAVLKKWLQEPDLSEDTKQKVDYTLFYWRPCSEWEEQNFVVGCFEKYLANYWKEDLPKMLLTCDIHNIFNNHTTENCCAYENDMNVFDLLKDRPGPSSRFCMPHVKLLKPTVVSCGAHNNCRLKVLHDDKCLEPYLCEGISPCIVTCEVMSKRQNQLKEVNRKNPWKKLIVETFASKDANRRTVSTLAQSDCMKIETYLHEKEGEVKETIAETIADDFLCMHDAEFRNTYNQHKRKEQLKKRLRSKLNKKYYFDPKDYEDPEYCWALYEQAQQAWICDMCEGNFKEVVHAKSGDRGVDFRHSNSFACVRRALTSVAVGTEDIVIGRVVNPSGLATSSQTNVNLSQEKVDSKTKSKKSKKKKKGNANGSSTNKSQSDSASNNLQSAPGGTVSQKSDVKVENDGKSASLTSDPKCCDKLELNGSNSNSSENKTGVKSTTNELKSTTKITTSVQTENSDVVMKSVSSSLSDKVVNSEKNSVKSSSGSNNVSANERTEPMVTVNNAAVTNLQDTEITNVPFQCLNNVSGKVESSAKGTLNEAEPSSVTSVVQDFHNDTKQNDKIEASDSVPVAAASEIIKVMNNNDTSSKVNEKSTVEKFLESIGIADENSPQRIRKTDTLIKNEALQITDNGIPEIPENAESPAADTAVDEFLTLIGVLKKPVGKLAESDSNSQESIGVQAKEVESTEKKVKFKTCAFCGKKEVQAKSFKRCARCKIENFPQQRYYCSRSCQLEDWEESHRDEHSMKTEPLL